MSPADNVIDRMLGAGPLVRRMRDRALAEVYGRVPLPGEPPDFRPPCDAPDCEWCEVPAHATPNNAFALVCAPGPASGSYGPRTKPGHLVTRRAQRRDPLDALRMLDSGRPVFALARGVRRSALRELRSWTLGPWRHHEPVRARRLARLARSIGWIFGLLLFIPGVRFIVALLARRLRRALGIRSPSLEFARSFSGKDPAR